jgi:hypothetical protein
MKKLILVLLFASLSFIVFCQSKNRIEISYGYATNGLFRMDDAVGLAGKEGNGASSYTLQYNRKLNNYLSIITGLDYSNNFVSIPNITAVNGLDNKTAYIEMISVPVYGKLSFWKYFFINAGATLDFELNTYDNQPTDKQSGIGLGFGIGAEYEFKSYTVFLNPFFQNHATIPFENVVYKLNEIGIRFGIGYNF